MKKADRISRIISLKTVCCFQYFVVSVGGVPPKSVIKIFDPRLELFSNRCLRKFESYMIGKTGVWYLRKNLVLFGPPDMQKTQEFPGFFGVVSFLFYPSGRVDQKRYRLFSSAFGVYHPRSQGHITQETRNISPAGLSSIMKICIICLFCSEINWLPATQRNGVAKQRDLSMGGLSCTRRK